jgi:hypothetical protein
MKMVFVLLLGCVLFLITTVQAQIDSLPSGIQRTNLFIAEDSIISGVGIESTILDGGALGRVITVEGEINVTLRDLTIQNGAFESGAGIYAYNGNITLERVRVVNNQATSAGSGIYTHTGSITLIDSILENNTVHIFSPNHDPANAYGAGIYSYSGQVTLINTRVINNIARAETCGAQPANALGAGLYTFTASALIDGSIFSGNTVEATTCTDSVPAQADGADVFTQAGRIEINNGQINHIAAGVEAVVVRDGNPISMPSPITTEEALVQFIPPTLAPAPSPLEMVEVTVPPLLMQPTPAPNPMLSTLPADVGTRWMNALLTAVQVERLAPPLAARFLGYLGVTAHESARHSAALPSLVGVLNGLSGLPQPETGQMYDWSLVTSRALLTVAQGLLPQASQATQQSFLNLQSSIEFQRGEVVPVNSYNRSNAYGDFLGQALLDWASTDNFATTRDLVYTLPIGNPAFWMPLEGQQPVEPYWGTLRPFMLPLSSFCDINPSVTFSTDPNSVFYSQAQEVKQIGDTLTGDQRAIAEFWSDTPGETWSPPGHWMALANQLVQQRNVSLADAGRIYAWTGISLADAFISAWATKYRVQLVRPVTYIQQQIDPTWNSILPTPPFPEFPSGHSVGSGAASTVLAYLLGNEPFTDLSHLLRNRAPRSFSNFAAAAEEAALSRLFGGIHYRFSIEDGLAQGRCIGQYVVDHITS